MPWQRQEELARRVRRVEDIEHCKFLGSLTMGSALLRFLKLPVLSVVEGG